MIKKFFGPLFFCMLSLFAQPLLAQAMEMTVEQSKKLDAIVKQASEWTRNAELVAAVREYNKSGRDSTRDMDQDKWSKLTIMDPIVKDLRSNAVAKFLRDHRGDMISEAFVSGIDGSKVGFISKPSSWSHKGAAKHDEPMSGKTWIGKPEKDTSTGLSQVQFALPVLDAGRPIGSLVVGVAVNKL